MNKENKKILTAMPKAILHLHLDGSLRPETVHKWLKEKGEDVTLEEVKKRLMVDEGCRDLNQYLEKFDLPVELLQTKEHIEQATYELFTDLAKQNVIYAEVRFAPSLHTQEGLSYKQIVESAIKGMNKAKQETGIEGNLILCCMRGKGNDNKNENINTMVTAKKYLGKGVAAVDLAGAEAIFPTETFRDIFNIANKQNIPFIIHAGEAAGPESIKAALEMGAIRIGHGVRCIEDPKLVRELKEKRVPLEICPISNLQTKATGEHHPVEDIYRKGIPVTISTDNNTVSGTDLVKEYEYILENTGLTISDIFKMNKNAIRAGFITPQLQATLIGKINEFQGTIEKENVQQH